MVVISACWRTYEHLYISSLFYKRFLPFHLKLFSTTATTNVIGEMSKTKEKKCRHTPSIVGSGEVKGVWTEFIKLAIECDAVNLGQGFPDSPMPHQLCRHLSDVAQCPERTEWHQYTRGFGHLRLVNVLAKYYSKLVGVQINPQTEILCTVGAYLSLYYAFLGWINPGDEVIIFEPAYDSYVQQIKMAGGTPVPIVFHLSSSSSNDTLTSAAYKLDLNEVRRKINSKTKMMVINNPNNPIGKLYSREELQGLADIAAEFDLIVLSDEVYEHHVYARNEMIRFASLPGMYERTITVGSAGKCFSATGWKTGWSYGREWLLEPMKKVHENCVFAISTPLQEACARAFEDELALLENGSDAALAKSYLYTGLAAELLPKRDALTRSLTAAGFRPIIPNAGYFILADFSHLNGPFCQPDESGDRLDYRFVRWLCREKKLAGIPLSAFYSPENRDGNDHFIRLCFFKKDETLDAGIKILEQILTSNNK